MPENAAAILKNDADRCMRARVRAESSLFEFEKRVGFNRGAGLRPGRLLLAWRGVVRLRDRFVRAYSLSSLGPDGMC